MATIKDIAKATGVSTMTVSRFFNSPEKLKPETYKKIKKAVEEMDYTPNLVAKLLVTQRTNIVCVYVASDIDNMHPFALQTIAGIGERLGENGYSMLLTREGYDKYACDGIITMGLTTEQEEEIEKISDKKPVIMFGNSNHKNNWVDIDNYHGSYRATEYMIERGYKKMAYIGIDNKESYSKDRYKGFKDALKAHGLSEIPNGSVLVPNREGNGYEAADIVLKAEGVEAVVCASDALAMGLMRYTADHNIRIPEDLGVIGFDGLGYEKLVTPNLTTMRQPVYEAGKMLAQRMVDVLKSGEYSGMEMFIEPILEIGGTTK